MNLGSRPELPGDEPFLRDMIVGSLALELGADSWPARMRDHLLAGQYDARRQSLRASYPCAESRVITADGANAGWICFDDRANEFRLLEIMVLSHLRGQGIGTAALRVVAERATARGKPLALAVGVTNEAAVRWYQRLGFQKTGGDEIRHELILRVD